MESEKLKTSHRIDMLCLVILYFSMFACLIRSDFNFAIIIFCYFAWQQRKDKISLNLILTALIVLTVYDILFALIEMRVWTSQQTGNTVWNRLSSLHGFAIFCSVINFILKFILVYFVYQGRKAEERSLV